MAAFQLGGDMAAILAAEPWSSGPRDATGMADLAGASAPPAARAWLAAAERAGVAAMRDAPPPQQWTRGGLRAMAPEWVPVWAAAVESAGAALAALPADAPPALAYLFARLGSDAGDIIRGLHSAGISWGTYQDTMCHESQYHCNAHANNFVVAAPGAVAAGAPGARSLLTCLDLDMAFDAAGFVDTETGAVGRDAAAFECLLYYEKLNTYDVLAGSDAHNLLPDSEPAQAALFKLRRNAQLEVAQSALSDTLLLNFRRASGLGEGCAPPAWTPALHEAAHALMRLAIIVMADYAA